MMITNKRNKKMVFLIGFMGAGKSFVGRNLAASLAWDHIDLDKYIEDDQQKPISTIFELRGEEVFREIERRCLVEVINKYDQVIISTGGGAPCFKDNIDLMNEAGTTIFISKSVDSLVQNLRKGMEKRPLITGMSLDELSDFVTQKLEQRRLDYGQAKFVIHDYHDQDLLDKTEEYVRRQFDL